MADLIQQPILSAVRSGSAVAAARDRALFVNFFTRELTTRYLGSATGLAWAFLHPLALLAVYYFVFTTVFRASGFGGQSFLAFVAVALWPVAAPSCRSWSYACATLSAAGSSKTVMPSLFSRATSPPSFETTTRSGL